jgi:hypothetical protein
MTAPTHDPNLGPEPSENRRETARQQFIHGLLSHLHADDAAAQQRRVRSVMSALEPVSAAAAASDPPRRLRWRSWSAVAAALALCGVIIYLVPGTPTALAMVESSLQAAAKAGDRRYEVRVPARPDRRASATGQSEGDAGEMHAIALIDLRGTDRMVARATNPEGARVAFGRDAAGAWSLRPDGTLDRLAAGRARPRWVELGESTILLDSAESLMSALKSEYDARRDDPAPLPDDAKAMCDRITAVRRAGPSPEPQRIEVWIDQRSHLPRRIELHWPAMGRRHGPGPGGPGAGDGPDRGPRDRRDRDGPPGRAPGADGDDGPPPPPDDRGPGGRPPPPRDDRDGPRMRPPGRPGGPDGPPPPRGDRRPPPPGDRPDGPPPRGHRGHGDPDRPPPRFIDGRPDFGTMHPPPPQVIVFQLVPLSNGSRIDDAWFSPEAHRAWMDEHNARWPGPGGGDDRDRPSPPAPPPHPPHRGEGPDGEGPADRPE